MSLDVYLETDSPISKVPHRAIFIRRDGQILEITQEEWDRLYPGREPVVFELQECDGAVYHDNITHNLGQMAEAAGLYEYLWKPEAKEVVQAKDIIGPLTKGLEQLKNSPEKFKVFNPANGWGNYEGLIRFVANYLEACKKNPEATVRVSR